MTFRFVLQNKNALLLTVLEIERTIYIGGFQFAEAGFSELAAIGNPLLRLHALRQSVKRLVDSR